MILTPKRILMEGQRRALRSATADLANIPESVWKRTAALNTWGTNALEGNTLTPDDVERLLLGAKSVADRPLTDVAETLQHEEAFRGLLGLRGDDWDLEVVQRLHEQVFRGIPRYVPGRWRLTNPYITGTSYRPPRREKVVRRLEAWLQEYRRRRDAGDDVFATAAWFHHEFESIHPFEDGNGRVGRLLLNLHFLAQGWPPVHVMPEDRKHYLGALQAGHQGDYAPLERLLEDAAARSLLDLMDQVGGPEDALHPLSHFARAAWNPYGAHYLSLRARQGSLAALHVSRLAVAGPRPAKGRPRYLTSERALLSYISALGRSDALGRLKGR
ncbi:MAG TPA: Fic family protein [Candidatus Thermoplasmatota archaeon]|nr:Fic family protein [Candidatus Thermoplasmatota archaeon]